MSFDLLDRLITDICQTTRNLIVCAPHPFFGIEMLTNDEQDNDKGDLSILNKSKDTSIEKQHSSSGQQHGKGQGKGGKEPMSQGVHRAVC
jgi:glutamate decarboxylase